MSDVDDVIDTLDIRGHGDIVGGMIKRSRAELAQLRADLQAAQQRIAELEAQFSGIKELVDPLEGQSVYDAINALLSDDSSRVFYEVPLQERIAELEADNDRLRQSLKDALSISTTDGLSASEWVARTGRAERRIAELEAQLSAMQSEHEQKVITEEQLCAWVENFDPDYWETSCGQTFILIEGTPQDNYMKYCPYCGAKIFTKQNSQEEAIDK
jgi:DNA-directed RNA polymerase subunit RPC12/RpoP/BMFP domain-containing protein YqiC